MSLLGAVKEITEFLEGHHIPYVLLGGLAVQYWGEPRTTRDVDVTVVVAQGELESFLQKTLERFSPRIADALSFARDHRVLLVKTDTGVPIDISLGIAGYEEEVMRRAVIVSFQDVRVRMISAEDLIIHKCVAGRARDREDVERILIRQRLQVDVAYIRRWLSDFAPLVETHDVQALFEEALEAAHTRFHNQGNELSD